MTWDVCTESRPIARKEYYCQASDWIDNAGFSEDDYTPEEYAVIQSARAERFKIFPGTKYYRVSGIWEGEATTFRAREALHDICIKYDFYME